MNHSVRQLEEQFGQFSQQDAASIDIRPPVGKITLKDLCTAIVDCEHKTAPTLSIGIPLIRTTDISNGRLNLDSANRVSEETYRKWSKRLEPEAGDMILAREAPIGEVGRVPGCA